MLKYLKISFVFVLMSGASLYAEDWTGQIATPSLTGSAGSFPYPTAADGTQLYKQQIQILCSDYVSQPPCAAGQHQVYQAVGSAGSTTPLTAVPSAAGAPGSNIGVQLSGGYYDPTSPNGIAGLGGTIPLSAFAKSSTVDALGSSLTGLNTTVAGLSSNVNAMNVSLASVSSNVTGLSSVVSSLAAQQQILSDQISQLQQQVLLQDQSMRQGVASAMAMSGTGDLGADEKVSLSMNWGTYGGQNAVAGAFAVRAANHFIVSGGIAGGLRGGPVGGRAGFRMAW